MDLPDQGDQIIGQGRPYLPFTFSFPIKLEGPLVPADYGLGLD